MGTYADGRVMLDADSHLMELPDFLTANADPGIRDRIPVVDFGSGGPLSERLAAHSRTRRQAPEVIEQQTGLGDQLLTGAKNYEAMGAFDTSERSQALDQLGFERQFVFSTFSPAVVFDARLAPDVAAGAAHAHNRGMAEFCAGEPRMLGVGATAIDDVDAAVAEIDHIVELGLGAVWIPHRAPGKRSPGHVDLDRFWAGSPRPSCPPCCTSAGTPCRSTRRS